MIDTEIYSKIDDDKKLKIKYYNKCNNAKKEGLKCELTFEEFFELLLEAGLKSSQLGFLTTSSKQPESSSVVKGVSTDTQVEL